MNIGYLRLSMNIELDYNLASLGNAEGRITLLKAIVEAGHDLVLLSQTTIADEQAMTGDYIEEDKLVDISWITSKQIKYLPAQRTPDNIDLMLIENGPDNLTFRDRYDNLFIRRMAEVLNRYAGPVVILNVHPDAPFPLHKLAFSEIQYNNLKNVYRKGTGSHVDHGWASYMEICKDKSYMLLVQCANPEAYIKMKNGVRQKFIEHNIPYGELPITFDESLVSQRLKPLKHDLVYMGYPRTREREFDRLYMGSPLKVDTWGPWHSKKNLKFATHVGNNNNVSIHGFLKGQVNITDILSQSLVTISLVPPKLQECGYITHRNLESVHAGCVNISTTGITGMDAYINKRFLFQTVKELNDFLCVLGEKKQLRESINYQQLQKIRKYNGEYMLKSIIRKSSFCKEI